MMHTALVHWSSPQVRGRSELPATLRYVGLSHFPEDGPDETCTPWSVVVLFDVPPPEQADAGTSIARVRFLVAEAPHERLVRGARFALFEGSTKVADVEVVE